ncbi:MAG: hypothetical protein CTY19_00070 [Methylomonas sp.]|nr:MAG: hypothetical protein CTY19_00070 [Methylomonas sp.]
MFQFKKLAIAGAVAASLLGAGAAQAHVSYHIDASGGQAPNVNGTGTITTGSWTGGSPVDKGYIANLPTTWLANIHHYNDVYEVSAADAKTKAGVAQNFVLESTGNRWKSSSSWGNALDYGLIDLDVAGNLSITVEADSSLNSTFAPGFSLFSGWGSTTHGNKHQAWNANPDAPSSPIGNVSNPNHVSYNPNSLSFNPDQLPLAMRGLEFIGYAATTTDGGSASKTFNNLAAGKYFLWIGGNGSNNSNEFYKASLSVAPVPVPGAVWLFGTAIAGMIGIGRRKSAISA